jgi:2-(1,2-epoxy-1,2-dihydrophenyl)acetyl-CoA isomerase
MTITVSGDARDIVTLTFNRPDALNAVDLAMARRMREVADELREDGKMRVLILRGAGRGFMAGGDVRGFSGELAELRPRLTEVLGGFHHFVRTLHALPVPVLASVHGVAAGGGLSLMLACDLAIAASDTVFDFAYRRLGASPDGGSTFALPRLVGTRKAMELLLARDRFDAEEARLAGLINWITAPEALGDETARIAERLASNSRAMAAATKRLLSANEHAALDQQLDAEARSFLARAEGPDFPEGVRAFIEKRSANFE